MGAAVAPAVHGPLATHCASAPPPPDRLGCNVLHLRQPDFADSLLSSPAGVRSWGDEPTLQAKPARWAQGACPEPCRESVVSLLSDLRQRLRRAIDLLESERGVLGDDVVELALRPLQEQWQRLEGGSGGAGPQLRHLSVLFCDVVGSTSLSQYLSPEAVSAVMDDALAAFTHIAELNGGSVLSYAGDSMLAVFGAPLAREDDAARAVRTGLAILAAARSRAQEVLDRHGHRGFNVRAGVATGGVLLGGGVDGDSSARGMTVNLAARMEQTAVPGSLRVCPDTWRLLRGRFEGDEQPPLMVKGRDEPIRTWLVQSERRGSASVRAGVAGLCTPHVGRADELRALQRAFAAVERSDAALMGPAPPMRQVIVLGDAGLGKSRLSAEFRAWAQQRDGGVRWFTAVATEADAQRPYGLLRRGFSRFAKLRDSDPPDTARHNWLAAFAPLLRSQGDAAVLGHLLGLDFSAHDEVRPMLDEAQQLRDRAFHHALQVLQRLASGDAPLVVLVDDLHWADRGTLDFLDHLLARAATLPLLMVGLGRPSLAEGHPGWLAQPGRDVLTLQALADGDGAALADALLAPLQGAAPQLRERLLGAAGGNPFFMEEWVQVLLDRGILVDDGERWQLREARLASWPVPGTLRGVLEARLDELDAGALALLQAAAVVGMVFWDDALAALGHADPADALAELQQRQFIVANEGSDLEGRFEYAFRHQTLRQVAYERVLERDRIAAHARVARWLAGLPGDKPLDRIAEHYERGGEPALACTAWLQAAQAAQVRYANEQALAHADRALRLASPTELGRKFEIQLLRQRVFAVVQDGVAANVVLDELDRLAREIGTDSILAEASDRRVRWLLIQGNASAALPLAEDAWRLALNSAPQQAVRAGISIVHALGHLGRFEEADMRAEEVIRLAQRIGDKSAEGAVLNALGVHADDRGDYSSAADWYQRALIRHRESGNLSDEAMVISNLGYVEFNLGSYDAADEYFRLAAETFSRIGQRHLQAMVLVNRALTAMNIGDIGRALVHSEDAVNSLPAGSARWMRASALRVAGQVEITLGRSDRAVDLLAEARDEFYRLKLTALELEAQAWLAVAQLGDNDQEGAQFNAQGVVARLLLQESLEGAEEPLRVPLLCFQVLGSESLAELHPLLRAACQELHERAARISNPARRTCFLDRVPCHRELQRLIDLLPH